MTNRYWLPVREDEPPHTIIGQIDVPYEAAIGSVAVVRLKLRQRPHGQYKTVALEIHRFIEHGQKLLAFKISRAEWAELEKLL